MTTEAEQRRCEPWCGVLLNVRPDSCYGGDGGGPCWCTPECRDARTRYRDVLADSFHWIGHAKTASPCGLPFPRTLGKWTSVREDVTCPACLTAIGGPRVISGLDTAAAPAPPAKPTRLEAGQRFRFKGGTAYDVLRLKEHHGHSGGVWVVHCHDDEPGRLREWFGDEILADEYLGTVPAPAAAPGQSTPVETPPAEPVKPADPIPMRLPCPSCGKLHLDVGEFATKSHHTHACQHCGMVWRPAVVATVGVEFLPGYKNEPAPTAPAPPGPVKPKPKEKPMRTKCCCDPRCIEAVEQGVDCPIHDVAPAPGVGEPRELTFAEAMAMVYGGRRVDYLLDGEWRPFPPPAIYVADIPALVKGQWRERPEPLPAPAPRVSRVQMLRAEWEQEDFDAPTRADVDRLCERVVEETLKAVRATYNPLGDVAKTLDRARTAMLEPPACPGRRP